MRNIRPTYLLIFCAVAVSLSFAVFSFGNDSSLSVAASRMRDKEYGDAYSQAAKSPESGQRSFIMGVSSLRQANAALALPLLADAEQKLPLLADYAVFYQANAFYKLKRYSEASAKAISIGKLYPTSLLLRRSEKLGGDIYFESGNFKAALASYNAYLEKYSTGADSVDALFHSARCREETGDKSGAVQTYRNIWLNNPASPFAKKSQQRLKELEKQGVKIPPWTLEELLKRASTLQTQNDYAGAHQTLLSIPLEGQSPAIVTRIDLRCGIALYGLRNWKEAEKSLTKAVSSDLPAIRAEARFWLAKTLERLEQGEKALAQYMELGKGGKRQEFAADALMEAARYRRNNGDYAAASRLFENVVKNFPESRLSSQASWEMAWCRYMAGEYPAASEALKLLIKDLGIREKCLYWLAKSLENSGSREASSYYHILLEEYPAGFYATWHREQKGVADVRQPIGQRNVVAELPLLIGCEKPQMLASLGLMEEARSEMMAVRKKLGDNKAIFPGLARTYLEMGDYVTVVALFRQNRPVSWDANTLPLWAAGFPAPYREIVGRHAASNALSEGIVFGLMRAESSFSPAVRSHAGALGLMQLMPATAKMTAREKGTFNPQRLLIPEYNIKLGTRHLRDLLKIYDGDVVYTLAAYNAGGGSVERWRKKMKGRPKDEFIENIPFKETRDYVKKVYASAATYRVLYGIR